MSRSERRTCGSQCHFSGRTPLNLPHSAGAHHPRQTTFGSTEPNMTLLHASAASCHAEGRGSSPIIRFTVPPANRHFLSRVAAKFGPAGADFSGRVAIQWQNPPPGAVERPRPGSLRGDFRVSRRPLAHVEDLPRLGHARVRPSTELDRVKSRRRMSSRVSQPSPAHARSGPCRASNPSIGRPVLTIINTQQPERHGGFGLLLFVRSRSDSSAHPAVADVCG
jgi:hypothetical protein